MGRHTTDSWRQAVRWACALGTAAALAAAHAQPTAPTEAARAAAMCPRPWQAATAHLLGTWQARWDDAVHDAPAPPQLRLDPHPEWAGNVKGQAQYAAQTALVVGDVNDGDVTLEESLDGQRISAAWLGEVVDGSCAQLIRGTYFPDTHPDGIAFTLQKISR